MLTSLLNTAELVGYPLAGACLLLALFRLAEYVKTRRQGLRLSRIHRSLLGWQVGAFTSLGMSYYVWLTGGSTAGWALLMVLTLAVGIVATVYGFRIKASGFWHRNGLS